MEDAGREEMAQQAARWLQQGLGHHGRGSMQEAWSCYQEALRLQPDDPDALHFAGVVAVQSGRLETGIGLIEASLQVRPHEWEALHNLINALLTAEEPLRALRALDRLQALGPLEIGHWTKRSDAYAMLGRYDEALHALGEALRLDPRSAELHFLRASLLERLSRPEEALAALERAIALEPRFVEAHSNRGNLLRLLGRPAQALKCYEQALALDPRHAEAHCNMGLAWHEAGRLKEALASLDRAIALQPGMHPAWNNRGNVLKDLGRLDEAVDAYAQANLLAPDFAEAWSNKGFVLMRLGRLEEALSSCDRALAIAPNLLAAWVNRGLALQVDERVDEALRCYVRAIELDPVCPDAHNNLGHHLLHRFDFARGWQEYEYRFGSSGFTSTPLKTSRRRWEGEPVEGCLYVWCEQGVGDQLLYGSLLGELRGRAERVKVSVDARLVGMMERAWPGLEFVSAEQARLMGEAEYGAHVPLGSVGRYVRPDVESFVRQPRGYLKAREDRLEEVGRVMREELGAGFRCALSWSSGNAVVGQHKTMELADMGHVLGLPGVSFVDVQYGETAEQVRRAEQAHGVRVRRVPGVDVWGDLEGVLAVLQVCDAVVTTSNTTAHLAGALGKPAVVLVPYSAGRFWYWHEVGGVSLWYPSVRVLRQPAKGQWGPVLEQAAQWLRGQMAARGPA